MSNDELQVATINILRSFIERAKDVSASIETQMEVTEELLHCLKTTFKTFDSVIRFSELIEHTAQEDVDINTLLTGIIENKLYMPSEITIEIAPALPTININKKKIETAFIELISNSINAVDPRKGLIKIDYESNPNIHMFAIEDNGQGVSEDTRKKIFQLFFTTSENRTGIGLTLARQIIESYLGSITLQPKSANGSIVKFSLPKNLQKKEK